MELVDRYPICRNTSIHGVSRPIHDLRSFMMCSEGRWEGCAKNNSLDNTGTNLNIYISIYEAKTNTMCFNISAKAGALGKTDGVLFR